MTITDVVDPNLTYNEDFSIFIVSGTGSLSASTDGTSATLVVNNAGVGSLLFRIRYTVTALRTYDGDGAPLTLCNTAEFDDSVTPPVVDQECSCPASYDYCGLTDSCVAE